MPKPFPPFRTVRHPIACLIIRLRSCTSAASASTLDSTDGLLGRYDQGELAKGTVLRILAARLGYGLRLAVDNRWRGFVEDLEENVEVLAFGRADV